MYNEIEPLVSDVQRLAKSRFGFLVNDGRDEALPSDPRLSDACEILASIHVEFAEAAFGDGRTGPLGRFFFVWNRPER
jgi:hypothetical protein